MDLAWYVARTLPRAEYGTAKRLETRGVECFLPCAPTPSPRPGREDAPLFPGYLFVHYDLEAWGSGVLRRIPGIVGLVTFNEVVPSIPDREIQELRCRVEALTANGGLWPKYRPGDRVWVRLEPTQSLAEVVTATQGPRARVRVLLEFLGRLANVEVKAWDVWPVEDRDMLSHHPRPRRTRGRGRWTKGFGPRTETNNGHRSS